MNTKTLYVLVIVSALLSCKNDPNPDPVDSKYIFLAYNVNEFSIAPIISTYQFPSRSGKPLAGIIPQKESDLPEDMVVNNTHAYVITKNGVLTKMTIPDFKTVGTVNGIHPTSFMFDGQNSLLAFLDDQLFIAGFRKSSGNKPAYCFITTYDSSLVRQDSIVYDGITNFFEFQIADGKLFLSVKKDNQHYLLALNAETKQPVGEILFNTAACTEIISLADHRILALSTEEVKIINTDNLSIEKMIPFSSDKDSLSAQRHYAYSKADNVLYYLSVPSVSRHLLSALDLNSGKSSELITIKTFVTPPVMFDERLQVILTGGDGLKIFRKNGMQLVNQGWPIEIIQAALMQN
jgi:hypothetical protein